MSHEWPMATWRKIYRVLDSFDTRYQAAPAEFHPQVIHSDFKVQSYTGIESETRGCEDKSNSELTHEDGTGHCTKHENGPRSSRGRSRPIVRPAKFVLRGWGIFYRCKTKQVSHQHSFDNSLAMGRHQLWRTPKRQLNCTAIPSTAATAHPTLSCDEN
jgi:hypothetical protein